MDKVEIINDYNWEIKVPIDKGLYLHLFGHLDSNQNLIRDFVYPVLHSSDISSSSTCFFKRNIFLENYSVLFDDNRIGISIIFNLSNIFEFLSKVYNNDAKELIKSKHIFLSAWSNEAKILLPIEKNQSQEAILLASNKERSKLIELAKNGNEKAIETLSISDFESFNLASDRLINEDIYSIVDNSFMPYGFECDLYLIIADILDFEVKTNKFTKEKIYDIKLSCNDIILHLAIHEKDLTGKVEIGRRIKANIWLQGRVEFENPLRN